MLRVAVQYLNQKKAKWVTPADQYISLRISDKDLRVGIISILSSVKC